MAIVTLITDFGTRDGYVGEMKGVLLERCPTVSVVDVTHDVEPGDIPGAAWVLGRVWRRFPEGTVHLVVVDPGVGGGRRAVALEHDGRWFVGPDNGLITRALPDEVSRARSIDTESLGLAPASVTFHGRDLFAPAAAWLAGGDLTIGGVSGTLTGVSATDAAISISASARPASRRVRTLEAVPRTILGVAVEPSSAWLVVSLVRLFWWHWTQIPLVPLVR